MSHIRGAEKVWSVGFFIKILVINFFKWIVIFANIVPTSLLVTLELVKFWQAKFINWDKEIICPEKLMQTEDHSSNLNEEAGQINYIFSDKTGTLTQNIMEFKKLSINGVSYGQSEHVD